MICPYCSFKEVKVVDSRESEGSVRRRRECNKCSKRFTTYERVENIALNVIKKTGLTENFDRNKLKISLLKACEKRNIPHEKIDLVVDRVELALRNKNTVEIPSKVIGEMVMKVLKKLDNVAYVRFASVYLNFEDAKDFVKEVKNLGVK